MFFQYLDSLPISQYAKIGTDRIPFHAEFRKMCEMNSCGFYGKCYMCPPDIGMIEALIDKAKQFKNAIVIQTVHEIEDSFDIEGMTKASKTHNNLTYDIQKYARACFHNQCLVLGAGTCGLCDTCAKIEKKPCRFPDSAIASVEAYGIAVSELARLCGIKYVNGVNTVTFFSIVLY